MSAKEMFEQLGFECERLNHVVIYELIGDYEIYVAFLYKNKKIESTYKVGFYGKYAKEINEAIHQQLLELGWLDE